VLWTLFAGGVIFLLVKVEQDRQGAILQEPDVSIHVKSAHGFLDEDEIKMKLSRKGLLRPDMKVEELNVNGVEQYLKSISHVKTVDIYQGFKGGWNIDLELREPIVRVFNKYGETYYLDEEGEFMSRTTTHTARIPVATGFLIERPDGPKVSQIINNDTLISILKLDDIYWISNYVCKDPLFQSLIGQIQVEKNGDLLLIPLVGGHVINFGSANSKSEVENKFEKLKVFYKEAMPFEGWRKYEEISLKYDGQIVCKKKKTNE
jgi:cell division protein FtsQ